MLRSMTAYVSTNQSYKGCIISCDIKSVNGKSLDINFKSNFILPKVELAIWIVEERLRLAVAVERPAEHTLQHAQPLAVVRSHGCAALGQQVRCAGRCGRAAKAHPKFSHHTAALSSALVAADANNILTAAAALDHRLVSGRHDE